MAPNRHRRQHQAGVARRLAFEMAASAMIGEGMRCRIFAVIAFGSFGVRCLNRGVGLAGPQHQDHCPVCCRRQFGHPGAHSGGGIARQARSNGGGGKPRRRGWRDWNVGGGRRSCGRIHPSRRTYRHARDHAGDHTPGWLRPRQDVCDGCRSCHIGERNGRSRRLEDQAISCR